MNTSIQDKIDATLYSLDNMRRAEMPPFFQTRLMARIENIQQNNSSWLPVRKPALLIALLLLCIAMNVGLLESTLSNKKQSEHNNKSSIENFSQEYNLSVQSPY